MAALSGAVLLASAFFLQAGAGAAGPGAIAVENEAGMPDAELAPVLAEFRTWQARAHAYFGVAAKPVTLRITRAVPFGFYRDGVVLLPPNDRQAMVEDWLHELTHHLLGRESSFFFREGAATHAVDALFAREGLAPRGWPYFGRSCDDWTALFARRGRMLPLDEMLAWPRYLGGDPEQDFRSWQIYLAGCSFVAWTIARAGLPGFRRAFAQEWPEQESAQAQRDWLRAVAEKAPGDFDPAGVLPTGRRYRAYAERLR